MRHALQQLQRHINDAESTGCIDAAAAEDLRKELESDPANAWIVELKLSHLLPEEAEEWEWDPQAELKDY